ncbi:hypothetical protein IE53DRAFT_384525 [Violaceomyces palustris]|uniref:Uncharacterized protein n=1 Tax=Violaceomyces palustris TaxID=1673888 RepID=A0ACD0P4D6_9BASI|nr:hypothetical protein IE53DRAFT_384525 [Violaceomyces palustris]
MIGVQYLRAHLEPKLLENLKPKIPELPARFVERLWSMEGNEPQLNPPIPDADLMNKILSDWTPPRKSHSPSEPTPLAHLAQAARFFLENSHSPPTQRSRTESPAQKVKSDFALPMQGLGPVLLDYWISIQNEAMRRVGSHDKFYARVLPIVQSSGTGKTRHTVELSARQAGFLVCVRSHTPRGAGSVSFPPQDTKVYEYFATLIDDSCWRKYEGLKRTYETHKRVACWFGAYCTVLAHALRKRMVASRCPVLVQQADQSQQGSDDDLQGLAQSPHGLELKHQHILQACWSTVVRHFAESVHSGADFVEGFRFSPPEEGLICHESALSHDYIDDSFEKEQVDPESPAKDGQSPLDPLPCRSHLLAKIDRIARDRLEEDDRDIASLYISDQATLPEVARGVAGRFLSPHLRELESLLPEDLRRDNFFFLAMDECMTLESILPVVRRVWREAHPQHSWILLIDTDPFISPLAGHQAKLASARMSKEELLRLVHPFINLPFDVAYGEQATDLIDALWAKSKTFGDLHALATGMGRALWNTGLYKTVQEGFPNLDNILLKLTGNIDWPDLAHHEDSTEECHRILAMVGQRLPLGYVSVDGFISFQHEQVARYLRVVSAIYDSVAAFRSSTPSEPVVSLSVAFLIRGKDQNARRTAFEMWSDAIRLIAKERGRFGLDLGKEGEEGFRILMSMATDLVVADAVSQASLKTRLPLNGPDLFEIKCAPISLWDWLRQMFALVPIGEQALPDEYLQLRRWSAKTYLNFTHFSRRAELVAKPDTGDGLGIVSLCEYWVRQTAILGPDTQPGWDVLIPIYTSETKPGLDHFFDPNQLSYVAIQVKNRPKSAVKASECFGPNILTRDLGESLDSKSPSSQARACLEIFVDLRSPVQRPVYKQLGKAKDPPPPGKANPRKRMKKSVIEMDVRHHLVISGFGRRIFPSIHGMDSLAELNLPLLFGFSSSHPEDYVESGLSTIPGERGIQDYVKSLQISRSTTLEGRLREWMVPSAAKTRFSRAPTRT